MASIFDDVRGQYLDTYGKVRMLLYDSIALMTPPLPPMEMDLVNLSDVKRASRRELDDFIIDREINITSQEVEQGKVKGVWVEKMDENLIAGYIPTNDIDIMEEIEIASLEQTNPLQVESTSLLNTIRLHSKIALFLKQYVLFGYSRRSELHKKDFIIDPSHVYDIDLLDKKLIPDNDVIYRKGKIVVTSKRMRDKLLSYLQTEIFNRPMVVETFSERKNIDGYYSSLPDFHKKKGQMLFLSLESLREWRDKESLEGEDNRVRYALLPDTLEPFFYRGIIGKGQLFLIQNVRGDLDDALKVAEVWKKNKYNIGADPGDVILEGGNYSLYKENGSKKGKGQIAILKYKNGNYAALLPIEKQ